MDPDNVACAYCGNAMTEWDHLNPLVMDKQATGFITEIQNLVPACGKCNQTNGNRTDASSIRASSSLCGIWIPKSISEVCPTSAHTLIDKSSGATASPSFSTPIAKLSYSRCAILVSSTPLSIFPINLTPQQSLRTAQQTSALNTRSRRTAASSLPLLLAQHLHRVFAQDRRGQLQCPPLTALRKF